MLDVAISFLWPDGMMDHTIASPQTIMPTIANGFRLTPTGDGHVAFIVATGRQWARLLQAAGIDDGGLMGTLEGQRAHGGRLLRAVTAVLSRRSTDEAVDLLAQAGIPVAPVLSLDQVPHHPQVQANGSIDHFDHPLLGPVRQANPAVRFADERSGALRPAPALGQHNQEVLRQLGFDDPTIEALTVAGVLASPPPTGPYP